MTFPFNPDALENVILKLGRTRSGVRRIGSPTQDVARTFGRTLYDALFSGEVGTCFRRSLDEADARGKGLRIRLRLGRAPQLADVPWEYLYTEGLRQFLVLSTKTPVVRYLEQPRPVAPLQVTPPLQVLLVVSSPTNLATLDVGAEVQKIHNALSDLEQHGQVRVTVIPTAEEPRATLALLRRTLRRGTFHVLHFIGHGGFDPNSSEGMLAFEDEHRLAHLVSGSDLATMIHDHDTLRLVLLNACEGARQSPADPLGGVAQSLVSQGIPAVIAMQFEITDEAATVFSAEFYAALADGYPIDAALAEARVAVFSDDNDVEWGTPVLYLRATDGRIFDVSGASAGRTAAAGGAGGAGSARVIPVVVPPWPQDGAASSGGAAAASEWLQEPASGGPQPPAPQAPGVGAGTPEVPAEAAPQAPGAGAGTAEAPAEATPGSSGAGGAPEVAVGGAAPEVPAEAAPGAGVATMPGGGMGGSGDPYRGPRLPGDGSHGGSPPGPGRAQPSGQPAPEGGPGPKRSALPWIALVAVVGVVAAAVFTWPMVFPSATGEVTPPAVPTATISPAPTTSPTRVTARPTLTTRSLPPVQQVAGLKATRGSVTVDGNTDDWQWQLVARAEHLIAGNSAATGDIYLMWDDEALYLLALVNDTDPRAPDPSQPSRVFRGDSVILELGPDKRKLGASDLARPTDAYYMFGLPSLNLPVIAILGPNAKGTSFEAPRDPRTVDAAITITREGYVLEAKIPWRTTRLNGVRAGAVFAANVQVSERRADSFSNLGMRSTNPQRTVGVRAHPAYWQDLELLA